MPPFSAVPTLFALTTDPTRYCLVPFCSMPPDSMYSMLTQQTRHAHSLRWSGMHIPCCRIAMLCLCNWHADLQATSSCIWLGWKVASDSIIDNVSSISSRIGSASDSITAECRSPALCRDVSERALRVLRKEAEKYSEVRSRLATAEGLHAAALFQEGLKQANLPQSPVKGKPQQGLRICTSCYV